MSKIKVMKDGNWNVKVCPVCGNDNCMIKTVTALKQHGIVCRQRTCPDCGLSRRTYEIDAEDFNRINRFYVAAHALFAKYGAPIEKEEG